MSTAEEDLLTTEEVAAMLRVKVGTLSVWRQRNQGPPSFKVRRRIRYRRSEFEAWRAAQETGSRRGEDLPA